MIEPPARFAPPQAYFVAALLSAIAVSIRFAIDPWFGVKAPLMTFQLAIFLAGIYGGFGPAVVATAICGLSGWYFFLNQVDSFAIDSPEDLIRLIVFGATGLIIAYVCDRMLRDRRRADVIGVALSQKVDELRTSQAVQAVQAQLMESMAEGVSLSTEDGRLLYTNAAHDAMFGYDRGELNGKHITVLNDLPTEENLKFVAGVIEVLRTKGSWAGEISNRKKDGSPFCTYARISTLKSEGEIQWLCVQEDISQRKADEAALRNLNLDLSRKVAELETLLEVLPIGIGIAEDPNCRVIRTNPSLAAMLKLPRDSNASLTAVPDQRPTTFKVMSGGLEVPADELPLQVAASTGRAVRDLELDIVFNDGHAIRLWESASPLFDEQGRPRGSVGAFVDVTERKKQDDIRGSWIQRLSESERRFRHMADNAPVLIWIADTEKKATWLNRPWLEFTGRTLDQELGHGWSENIHPDDLERSMQTYFEAFDARRSFTMDYRCRRADGQYRWLADSGTPLYGQDNEFTGYIGSCIDITDRIVAHEERQLLVVQLMQRSSELAVLSKATQDVNQVLDTDSIFSTLVTAALQMTGAEGGMAGRVEGDLLRFTQYHRAGERTAIDLGFRSNDPRGVPNWIMQHRKPYLCDDAFQDEVVRPDVRAAFKVHNLIAVPIFGRDDRLLGVLELHNKPAPEQFTKHDAEKLQGLAAGAAIALENAGLLHQVREADRRKDEFLAMLAHELRNPLAPVRSAIDLLRLDEGRDEQLHGLFEIMDRQISHMGRLIDDLLDVSRITRGRIALQKKEIDLAALISTVVADHRQVTADAGLTLTAEIAKEPMWIFGDETRLAQVIDNLFGNSVKFTERGGKLEVTLGLGSEPGEAELSIRDTGIGIGAEDLPRIFNAFAQADHSLDRRRGGLGLGLALAKGIVELHGGRIQAASTGLGKGSTFTLQLPLIPKPVPAEPDVSIRVAPKASLRVLIVEDNRDAADTLRMLLKAHGYDVSVAYSGPEGVEAATLLKPEVVLCDIGLPGMDGYSVATALRAQPESEGLRLIALSGYGREEDRQRALEAGFDDHMTKPADIDKVLGKLVDFAIASRLSPDTVGR